MKRRISIILIAFLCITSSNVAFGYTGVKPWFETEIYEADTLWDLIPDSLKEADLSENITRGEFAEVISKAYLSVHESYPFELVVNNFLDTDNRSANVAFQLGVVSGYPDNTFREHELISRQELFKMIQRFLLLHNERYEIHGNYSETILAAYTDQQLISDWAKGSVAVMVQENIVKGTGKKTIDPIATTSRAEALVLAKRMLTVLAIKNPETVNLEGIPIENLFLIEPEVTQETQEAVETYNPLYSLGYNDAKFQLIFQENGSKLYQSDAQARLFLQSVEVNVWLVDGKGNKYPGKRNLLVNKAIVPMVISIFEMIYQGEEKFPIKDVSCYAWRSSTTSEHRFGIAIDINPVENYMIRSNGTIAAGVLWDPQKNSYSIPENGDVVNAFKKYGFSWGGNAWSSSKDYMHFSYLGH
jgi:hypothetical protein